MKYKLTSKIDQCCYEEYDKDHFNKTRELKACAVETNIKAGNKYVCIDHLSNAMFGDKNPEMEDCRDKIENGKTIKSVKSIAYREDFLKLCKGEDVNISQLGFFKPSKSRPDISKMPKEEKKIRACDVCTIKRCTACKGSDLQKTIID